MYAQFGQKLVYWPGRDIDHLKHVTIIDDEFPVVKGTILTETMKDGTQFIHEFYTWEMAIAHLSRIWEDRKKKVIEENMKGLEEWGDL